MQQNFKAFYFEHIKRERIIMECNVYIVCITDK
ncbi:hypothetical protein Newbould305_2664 [Staphylococcus aureus subsp. aureus str. Newbould 305]|nr:hypothetical protein Newbould305_2664 [Staphylococcus aureus subsp. aureus str. Newbould 305]